MEGNLVSRKEEELSFEHAEFSHPESSRGEGRSLAQRGDLDQGYHCGSDELGCRWQLKT